jgi:hypothetical protein
MLAINCWRYGVSEPSGGKLDLGAVGTLSSVGLMTMYELYAMLFWRLTTPLSVYLTYGFCW